MTNIVEVAPQPADTSTAMPLKARIIPKAILVRKLLQRGKGVTVVELQEATAWQAHSVRAFLSGIRKNGDALVKEKRKSGEIAYRLAAKGGPANA